MEQIARSSSKILKQLTTLQQDTRFRTFIVLLSIALLIWFGGPYVAIAGHSIFANTNHRLVAVLALAILWALINLRNNDEKTNTSSVLEKKQLIATAITPAITSTVKTEMKQLQNIFRTTIRSLKRSQKKRFWASVELPTYLVLGVSHSGKTSLLTQANSDNPSPSFSEKYYDGWLIEDGIFFDYIENEAFNNPETELLLWHQFLKLIKKHKRKLSFRGIIVAVDLSQLLQQNSTINAEKVCQRLQAMAELFITLPVYLIFTHCDLIAGFTDFFEDLNQEERAQALGFTFPNIKTSRNFREVFDIQLNTLLKRLNERLIWRLHQEHNPQKRARIKDFPFQLEILKNAIANLVNQIGNVINVKLCGSYFTSCSQQQPPLNFLTHKLEKHFNLKQHPATLLPKNSQNKTFFSEKLLQQIINHSLENNQMVTTRSKKTYITYALAALVVISCSSFWLENYADNLATINTLQLAINNSKNINDHDPYAVLPYLTILSQALVKINTHHTRWLYLDLQQTDQLKIIAAQTYQDLLATRFLPAITKILTVKLQNDNTQNPADTYNALKTYLMLTDLKERDPQFIAQWFNNYWQQQLPLNTAEQQQLTQQLNQLLQQKTIITPNWQLIAMTRNTLNQIPVTQLLYSLLLNHYQQPIKLMPNNDVLSIDNYAIPVFFTLANFSTVYHQQIPQLSQQIINAQWVLGDKNSLSAINLQQLISQLQLNYLNQYANAWVQLLTKINLNIPQNLTQTAQTFKILGGSSSPLWQLLNTININTSATGNDTQFASIVSTKFLSLNNFIQSPAYDDFQKSFAMAKDYFNKIYASSNPDKAAFYAAAKRMENNGQKDVLENLFQQIPVLPIPLQGWTNSLALNSWHFLLTDAQNYLNTVWSQSVLPPYHTLLDNKYPLYKDASTDANLADFAIFFAPDGTIDNFFNYFLKPFVDTHNVYWVWKTVDNDHLAVPQTTLEMFIRAAIIKKMYFAEGGHQPFVKFTLTPLGMEPGVVDFNLNIEGQIINLQINHTPQVAELSWPGPDPDKVIMQFTNNQGKLATTTESGPWAWFRLLAKANLQTAWKNPKLFKVTFDLNGNSVKYQLMASDLVNPFIAGIVDVFRCPEKL